MPQLMTCEYFAIAGKILKVTARQLQLETGAALDDFRVAPQQWDHELELRSVTALSAPEGEEIFAHPSRRIYRNGDQVVRYHGPVEQGWESAMLRISRYGRHSDVEILLPPERNLVTCAMLLQAMEVTHFVTAAGGFLLHAAHICWEDQAILFTAPSGVGKSTQAELWQAYRHAEICNGDRAILMPREQGVLALGVPYGGSSGIAKKCKQKLSAIVYVQQAQQNSIRRLTGLEAFRHVWEGCSLDTWCREDVAACTDAVLQTIEQVPVYLLGCTPDEGAVLALEGVLKL